MAHAGQVRYAIWLEPETMVARAVVAFKFNFKVGASALGGEVRSGQVYYSAEVQDHDGQAEKEAA